MNRIMLAEMRLPFPPSLNHYWRKDKTGMHISEEGKRYLSSIRQLVLLYWKEVLKKNVDEFTKAKRIL